MGKENINLPKTAFSMRANLQHKEPEIVDFWNKIDLSIKRDFIKFGRNVYVRHFSPVLY